VSEYSWIRHRLLINLLSVSRWELSLPERARCARRIAWDVLGEFQTDLGLIKAIPLQAKPKMETWKSLGQAKEKEHVYCSYY
jgi:hypothetical protein